MLNWNRSKNKIFMKIKLIIIIQVFLMVNSGYPEVLAAKNLRVPVEKSYRRIAGAISNHGGNPFERLKSLLSDIKPDTVFKSYSLWNDAGVFMHPIYQEAVALIVRYESPSEYGDYPNGAYLVLNNFNDYTYALVIKPDGSMHCLEKDPSINPQELFEIFLESIQIGMSAKSASVRLFLDKNAREERINRVIPLERDALTRVEYRKREQVLYSLEEANSNIPGIHKDQVSLELFFKVFTLLFEVFKPEEHILVNSLKDACRFSRYPESFYQDESIIEKRNGADFINVAKYQRLQGNDIEFVYGLVCVELQADPNDPNLVRVFLKPRHKYTMDLAISMCNAFNLLLSRGIPVSISAEDSDDVDMFKLDFRKAYMGHYKSSGKIINLDILHDSTAFIIDSDSIRDDPDKFKMLMDDLGKSKIIVFYN